MRHRVVGCTYVQRSPISSPGISAIMLLLLLTLPCCGSSGPLAIAR